MNKPLGQFSPYNPPLDSVLLIEVLTAKIIRKTIIKVQTAAAVNFVWSCYKLKTFQKSSLI